MHPIRKQRLIVVLLIVVGSSLAAFFIIKALKQNLNLFYEPSRVANGEAPIDRQIRVGGMVAEGSLIRQANSLTVNFIITDFAANVAVEYSGILPDMFAENAGTVVTGFLSESGIFFADQVLAKHDENYMPPEVSAALDRAKDTVNQPDN
ncbi:MAG: cytochrome c maturation protein CcmE [Pseudomonadota bacterium]|nr:cytochrome c maturation protein CcmE [Pseudomonadota bacterium]